MGYKGFLYLFLQVFGAEGVTSLDAASGNAGFKPALALGAGAVGKAFRYDCAAA